VDLIEIHRIDSEPAEASFELAPCVIQRSTARITAANLEPSDEDVATIEGRA